MPSVGMRAEKLLDEVAVRGVYHDSVRACFLYAFRAVDKLTYYFLYFLQFQCSDSAAREITRLDLGRRDRRWNDIMADEEFTRGGRKLVEHL